MLGKFNVVPTVSIEEREPVHLGVARCWHLGMGMVFDGQRWQEWAF